MGVEPITLTGEVARLRPHDRLLVVLPSGVSPEEVDRVADGIADGWPDLKGRILILANIEGVVVVPS